MPGINYGRLRASASRLIGNAGQPGIIRRSVAGSGPEWDPGEPTLVDYACTFVEDTYSAFETDGTLIRATDRKLIVSPALAVVPTEADRIVVGGKALEIVRVAPVSPGGAVLLYQIQARG